MSVMSRTTYELLPRIVTSARHLLEGDVHWAAAVGLALGEAAADGEGEILAVGVEPPQADATRAVTANSRIQLAVFMSLQR
jgi:hypothetical protein